MRPLGPEILSGRRARMRASTQAMLQSTMKHLAAKPENMLENASEADKRCSKYPCPKHPEESGTQVLVRQALKEAWKLFFSVKEASEQEGKQQEQANKSGTWTFRLVFDSEREEKRKEKRERKIKKKKEVKKAEKQEEKKARRERKEALKNTQTSKQKREINHDEWKKLNKREVESKIWTNTKTKRKKNKNKNICAGCVQSSLSFVSLLSVKRNAELQPATNLWREPSRFPARGRSCGLCLLGGRQLYTYRMQRSLWSTCFGQLRSWSEDCPRLTRPAYVERVISSAW